MEFWRALLEHTFLQHALLAGVLASVSAGIMGSYVVTRRISFLAGAIAHFVLGGMGAARYLDKVMGWSWLSPLHGAVVAAVLAAVIIAVVSLRANQREDTVIGAIWAVGMAAGILFISRTPGYNEDLMSYLFGNILMVTREQLWMLLLLDAVVLLVGGVLYNQFLAICFDEQFARIRGLPVDLYYILLLVLTALTVVVLTTVVGIVMVIALLTLPAAVAGQFVHRLWQMMLLSIGLCVVFTSAGLALSFGPDFPAGSAIVLLAGAVYLITLIGKSVAGRFSRGA